MVDPPRDGVATRDGAFAGAGSAAAAWAATATGLLVVALAYHGGRIGAAWVDLVYWAGMALMVLPALWMVRHERVSRRTRVTTTLVLAAALYGVKVLYSPLRFAFHDELQHWRTLTDITASGRLFEPNPLLPISPDFPGLEIVTHALASTTGMDPTIAAMTIVGLAVMLGVAAAFTVFEHVTESTSFAMVAVLVYLANPHFTFFNGMFAYQSLSLPLMLLALACVQRWASVTPVRGGGHAALALLVMAAVVVTHHVTSLVLLGILVVWLALAHVRWTSPSYRRALSLVTAWQALAIVSWHLLSGAGTIEYLAANLGGAGFGLLRGGELAVSIPALDRPLWELAAGAATVAILSLSVPLGAWALRRRASVDPLVATFLLLAASYYVSIALRFLPRGAEWSGRSWSFVYLGLAVTMAAALGQEVRWRPVDRRLPVIPVLAVVFVGSVVLGHPAFWGRTPGPYLVSAFERSIEAEGIASARWIADELDPNVRIATDYTNSSLAGGIGNADPVRSAYPVYFASQVGATERALLDHLEVSYLLADRRLCRGVPATGYYIDPSEPTIDRGGRPLACQRLTKFDSTEGLTRAYDSGSIRIYALASQQATTADGTDAE